MGMLHSLEPFPDKYITGFISISCGCLKGLDRMEMVMQILAAHERESMLRITTQKKRGKIVLDVEGRLTGQLVGTLEQCWRELRGASPDEKVHLNLCGVSFIDAAGRMLLKEIHRQGGELVAEGCLNQAIVEEIVKSEKDSKGQSRKERGKGSHIVFYIALFSLLMAGTSARAQSRAKARTLPAGAPTEVLRLTLDQSVALALK